MGNNTSNCSNKPRQPYPPREPYKPYPPGELPINQTRRVGLSDHMIGWGSTPEEKVDEEIQSFVDDNDLSWEEDEKAIDVKRLELEQEYKDWQDSKDHDYNSRGWCKCMTIAQLIKLLPEGIDHNNLHIDLGLENSESCESPMLHGISVSWVVTLTEEERENIRKENEEKYQKQLANYEIESVKYKEAMIVYHNDFVAYNNVLLPAWVENLSSYGKEQYKLGRI